MEGEWEREQPQPRRNPWHCGPAFGERDCRALAVRDLAPDAEVSASLVMKLFLRSTTTISPAPESFAAITAERPTAPKMAMLSPCVSFISLSGTGPSLQSATKSAPHFKWQPRSAKMAISTSTVHSDLVRRRLNRLHQGGEVFLRANSVA